MLFYAMAQPLKVVAALSAHTALPKDTSDTNKLERLVHGIAPGKFVMANISSIDRTLDIIELLADYPEGLAISDIARRLTIPKSIVHRVLSILVARDFATQDSTTQHYRLAIRAAALGLRFFGNIGLSEVCQPIITRLAQVTGEFVRVCAAENSELVWVASAQGSLDGLRYDPATEVGPVLHATATGRAWLSTLDDDAALAQVRRRGFILPRRYARSSITDEQQLFDELRRIRMRGYAISSDESAIGIAAIAAPISDRENDAAVGCVSVAGPSVHMPSSHMGAIAPDLLAAAKELSEIWPIPRLKTLSTAPKD
ncbi:MULTISPECIES: IclR family transcriptional regulator [unclassified Sinorhizobium]|uniref:IclR family transcriptional regulator n=1 Tax=unclassified Sinorhizobium TaxID=2613772 RepID=UPI0024C36E92|nr:MULTISPECIES: IclR family transcriptional regulator [unclassified Sinorhizobium]MDK1378252.1 IclR family transcriptional regulator [Sinorhizobium sp. 6-70]MDK1480365.1 IclR family transcriptional regulator [Sinorhizobium sp. 6-117]